MFAKTHATKKLAESFQAKLTTAAREGIPFDVRSGLPAPMAKLLNRRSWFQHACEYDDIKWPHISPGHRRGISETVRHTSKPRTVLHCMAVSRNRRLTRLHSHVRSNLVSGAANGLANSGLGSDQTTMDVQPELRQCPACSGLQWTVRTRLRIRRLGVRMPPSAQCEA